MAAYTPLKIKFDDKGVEHVLIKLGFLRVDSNEDQLLLFELLSLLGMDKLVEEKKLFDFLLKIQNLNLKSTIVKICKTSRRVPSVKTTQM